MRTWLLSFRNGQQTLRPRSADRPIATLMQFSQIQLPNGLHILGEVNPQAHSVALGYFVRTGSRDETPDVAGVSHFLEHMAFKGDDR